jgi:Ca-activated chloride channel family protein
MIWIKDFTIVELAFMMLFLLAYLLYFYRVYRTSRITGASFGTVLFKFIIRSATFGLLLLALLGPSFGTAGREVKTVGKDIFICVDLSQSMNAFDIQPSRLEKMKFELKNLASAFSSDRIGLIIFSGEAFIQCPLTYDQSALNLFIETLNTGLVPNTGTDFGPPLRLALDKLQNDPDNMSRQTSKVIILISDGEDFGEDTDAVANDIKDSAIRLFTLGVGTEEGSRIRERGRFKRDRQGREVITRLNSDDLQKLASTTNGQYFEINNRKNEVERLINVVQSIKGEVRDARMVSASANKFYYFLAAALALLALDLLLSLKVIRL